MKKVTQFLPLYGKWDLATEGVASFTNSSVGSESSHGLILSSCSISDGIIEADIELGDASKGGAALVFRANGQSEFYSAGIGGFERAYTLFHADNMRFSQLRGVGSISNIESNRKYRVRIQIEGQRVDMSVDGVKLISYTGVSSNDINSVGAFCFNSTSSAAFQDIKYSSSSPKAFIAMQFSDPYNEVYVDAIKPIVSEIGYEPIRVDDVHTPGIVINDIVSNIVESSIVIAEVSERNANVYYELGIAHSIGKPTVLLAQKGTSLPFDVGVHRCIFMKIQFQGGQSCMML